MTPAQRRELALISARLRTIRGKDGELLKDRTLLSSEAIDAVCIELLRLHEAAQESSGRPLAANMSDEGTEPHV